MTSWVRSFTLFPMKKDERLHFRAAWTNINHFSWPRQTFIINVWAECEVTQCQLNTPLTGSYTSILPSWDLSLMYTKIAWFSIDWAFEIQKLKNWLLFIWCVPVSITLGAVRSAVSVSWSFPTCVEDVICLENGGKLWATFVTCRYSEILFMRAVNQVNFTRPALSLGRREELGCGVGVLLKGAQRTLKKCQEAHMLQNFERRVP